MTSAAEQEENLTVDSLWWLSGMADPWLKFYTGDWLGEPKLKLVSRAARSLWIDMLCLMHAAGTGRLEVKGRPMTEKELAKMLGDNPRTTKKLLKELSENGVSIIVQGSFIGSSRMIEDFKKAERDRLNGRKGGNPSLKIRENEEKGVNAEVKAQKPEARSQKEEDKSSSQEVENYLRYLEAHPNPVESEAGERAFSELVNAGEDPEKIIAAACAFADHVKGWSSEGKVQQSDNFLKPLGGKWRGFAPKPKAPAPTKQEKMAFYARSINEGRFVSQNTITPTLARDMIAAGLVTAEKLAERGFVS